MDQQQRVRMLSGVLAVVSVMAAGIFTYDRFRGTADVVSDELVGIVITSDNEAGVIAVGDSIELTAEGDYATMTQPIRASFRVMEGEEFVELTGCGNRRACIVTGREPGVATILAEAEGFEAAVDITVEAHEANPFTDDLPAWAADAIIRMYNLGVIRGYEDGRFGASDPVTRGQVITLLTRILTHAELAEEPQGCVQEYGDIAPDHYAFSAACLFRQHGWSSLEPGFFPDTEASRGQTAAFVARVFGETIVEAMGSEPPMGEQIFDDVPVGSAFYGDVAVVSHTEVMTGYPNGTFGPEDELNRAAVAVIMDRLLSQVDEYGITELIEEEHPAGGDGGESNQNNGASCTSNSQCGNGFCSDGVCCNTACTGVCQQCNAAGQAGTCANVPAGSDPENECGDWWCSGAASCSTGWGGGGGTATCNGISVDTRFDNRNCGQCNTSCAAADQCMNGQCVTAVDDFSVLRVDALSSLDRYDPFSVYATVGNVGNTLRGAYQNTVVEFRFDERANGSFDHTFREPFGGAIAVGTDVSVSLFVDGLHGQEALFGDPQNEWPLARGMNNILACVILPGDDVPSNDCQSVTVEVE